MYHRLSRQSSTLTHYSFLSSFTLFRPTSLILLPLMIWVPVTSRSRCPTALLTNRGREREKKETEVDRGEDEADGSRGSINSLFSWWLLWEGGWGVFISQLPWFSLRSFKTFGVICAIDVCICIKMCNWQLFHFISNLKYTNVDLLCR